jgi:tetraacyldisaccharide 4'-kinase
VKGTLWPLLPLVPLYGAAQALNDSAYAWGWRRTERLALPVVSVGNLSVGGAGKTPFVIALAGALAERGWAVDVLSRGYGRQSNAVEQVLTEDVRDPARRYGDEPLLIADSTGVPVFVGPRRMEAWRLAEATLVDAKRGRHVHLLDDAMQHRRVARDAEIVLLHRSDFRTTLLPAGRLREPLAALRRADFVVMREDDVELTTQARRWMRPDAEIWTIRRELVLPRSPSRAVVFCAIAHPEEFFERLRAQGVAIAATRTWRDHHRFTDRDIETLCDIAKDRRAESFLTTQKDMIRIATTQRLRLEQVAPLAAAGLKVRLAETDAALTALEQRLLNRST